MTSSPFLCDNCGAANQAQSAYCRSCGLSLQSAKPSIYHSSSGQLLPDILLKQRYRIVASLGQGGMGVVYKAEDTQLGNRQVALKEMIQSGLNPQQQKDAADAFKQEAIMLARLHHPNLPSIFDHFEENGRWYLVMNFIKGETLADYMSHSQRRKLPLDEVVQIGTQLCTVLSYLHNQQPAIIFRDLKLANIMRTPEGHIYLIDFGIARHFKGNQTHDTRIGYTPGYAAPEQYGSSQTSPRSDIYSLGVVLYQLLSGHNPSVTPFQFPPLRSLVATVPIELATLITHMLELDENKRPASMQIVGQKLQSVITSPRSIPPTPPIQPRVATSRAPISPPQNPARRLPPRQVPPANQAILPFKWGKLWWILVLLLVVFGVYPFLANAVFPLVPRYSSNPAQGGNNVTQTTTSVTVKPSTTSLTFSVPSTWSGVLNGCGGVTVCDVKLTIQSLGADGKFIGLWLANFHDGSEWNNVANITGDIRDDLITWDGNDQTTGTIVKNGHWSGQFHNGTSTIVGLAGTGTFTINQTGTSTLVPVTVKPSTTSLTLSIPSAWSGVLNPCGGVPVCDVKLTIQILGKDGNFIGLWSADTHDGTGFSNTAYVTGDINGSLITWSWGEQTTGTIVKNGHWSGVFSDGISTITGNPSGTFIIRQI